MTTKLYQDRLRLRYLLQEHPDWGPTRLAHETGRSLTWVKKWRHRLQTVPADDMEVLKGLSTRPKTPQTKVDPTVVQAILAIRDDPPENLKRVPGPLAIRYYLHRDEKLKAAGHYLPTSTSTIWGILDENERIERPKRRQPEPLVRADPLEHWQMDFKDVTTAQAPESGKRSHQVESLNIVDCGTSILVDNPVRMDFNSETIIGTLAQTFGEWGLPKRLQFDRDPRFVGSWTADEFPSALMRFLLCLDIELEVCPPHRPDKNAFVERFNRSYQEECLLVYAPQTVVEAQETNATFKGHYNLERPNQAKTCGNLPPLQALAQMPTLPALPQVVDPNHWLTFVEGQTFERRVNASGSVHLGNQTYYVSRAYQGRSVLVLIKAQAQSFSVISDGFLEVKTIPLKGLHQGPLAWDDYLTLIQAEAVSEWRRHQAKTRRYQALTW